MQVHRVENNSVLSHCKYQDEFSQYLCLFLQAVAANRISFEIIDTGKMIMKNSAVVNEKAHACADKVLIILSSM